MILDRLKIRETVPGTLEIRKTRRSALSRLTASMIWYPLCYGILYFHFLKFNENPVSGAYFSRPFHVILFMLPLWYLPFTVMHLRALIKGERFLFDKGTNSLQVNGKNAAALDQIEQVQMVTIRVIDQTEQQLNLFLQDGRKIIIDQSDHYDEISHAGRRLAVFLAVDVVDLHK